MLRQLNNRFSRWYDSCDFPSGTYDGARKLLMPPDFFFSMLAKRSYSLYRLWDIWADATKVLFPVRAHEKDGSPELFEFNSRYVDDLRSTGVTEIPDAFPQDWIEEARDYIMGRFRAALEKLEKMSNESEEEIRWYDEDGVFVYCSPRQGRYRFGFPTDPVGREKLPRPIQEFMRLPVAHQIIEEYYGMSVTPCRPGCMAEVMLPGNDVEQWHIDCFRKGVKAFLYLTEVTAAQAPFRYLTGTHVPDSEAHRHIYSVGRTGTSEAYYDESTNRRYDEEAQVFTRPANTLLLFDNRGRHAGSACTEGMRVVLVNGFRPATSTRINPMLIPHLSPAKDGNQRRNQREMGR